MTKTTLNTNSKNATLRNLAKESSEVSRNDSYTINPRNIVIDWKENPREDYGTPEEQAELEESIKLHGIMQPVHVYTRGTEVRLAHGFRRMRAVLSLIEKGVNIEKIAVTQMEANEEAHLIAHFTLNTGKPMTDLEVGETLNRLAKLMGKDNFAEISRRTGIEYQKVVRLVNFVREASSRVKDAVAAKEVSISAAAAIVSNTASVSEQNETLEKAKSETKNGKIKVSAVAKITGKIANKFDMLVEVVENAPDGKLKAEMKKLIDAVNEKQSIESILESCF